MSAIDDALDQLKHHRGLAWVAEPEEVAGATRIEVGVRVQLPSRESSGGVSSTGVRAVETCTLVFTKDWPLQAPRPNLRADFPLHFPHINPHRPGHLVSPCVYEGSLDELLHRFGLDAIVDQVIDWLHHAAAGTLIDPRQGWEPTRRDSCPSTIVFSAEELCATVPTDGTVLTIGARYLTLSEGVVAHVDRSLAAQPAMAFDQVPQGKPPGKWASGQCAAFIVRAPMVDGKVPVDAVYRPETVIDLDSLLARAADHSIDRAVLGRAIEDYRGRSVVSQHGDRAHDARTWTHGLYAIVILLVQRPAKLIGGSGRSVECLPYVVHFEVDPRNPFERKSTVHAAYHAHALSPELLARTSGVPPTAINQKLVLLGCGSVGSKIGMHLAKAGFGNTTFVDKEGMSPHNVARHGLTETGSDVLPPNKAGLMKAEFEKLAHAGARAFDADAVKVLGSADRFAEVVPSDTALIVDSTASLHVLAAAVQSAALAGCSARVARALMYSGGRCALLMLEGAHRACRVDDLDALFFEACRSHPGLRASMAGDRDEAVALYVGDNCRSLTMPMSDAVVARAAAPMAMQIERWLTNGLPKSGQLCLGMADASGIGMTWGTFAVGATTVLRAPGDGGWSVRVLPIVADMIDADAERWGDLETGGALVGRISHEARTITIAGLVAAPPDSVRKKALFVLGTQGLVQSLKRAHADSMGHLSFIGTWHSHPQGGGHSGLDRATLKKIAEDAGGRPAVSLVWTPGGLTCEVDRW